MNPALLFLIAILSPIVLLMVLVLPAYAAIVGACYIVYAKPTGSHPLMERIQNFDMFYLIDTYQQLLQFWMANKTETDLLHYTLPVVGLPLLALVLTQWLLRKLVAKLRDIFELASSH